MVYGVRRLVGLFVEHMCFQRGCVRRTLGSSSALARPDCFFFFFFFFVLFFVVFFFVVVFFFFFFVVHRNRQESGCEGSDWNALMRALIRVLVVRMCIFASEGGASEEYSYLSAHPRSLIVVCGVDYRGPSGENPDCTARICRLIGVFVVHMCGLVGIVGPRHKRAVLKLMFYNETHKN